MKDYLKNENEYQSPGFASYHDDLPFWSALFGIMLLDNIAMYKNSRILDVGFGTGFPIIELAQRFGSSCELHGVDIWEHAIERAKEKKEYFDIKNVTLHNCDAEKTPFEEDYFDLVVSNVGLNNFENQLNVFREVSRVTRTGGKLILTSNNVGHFKEFYDIFRNVLSEVGDKEMSGRLEEHIQHRSTVVKLRDLYKSIGYKIVKIVEKDYDLRFSDGTAFLNHYLVRFGFIPAFKTVIDNPELEGRIFSKIENRLNDEAERLGEISFSIPAIYIEGTKE